MQWQIPALESCNFLLEGKHVFADADTSPVYTAELQLVTVPRLGCGAASEPRGGAASGGAGGGGLCAATRLGSRQRGGLGSARGTRGGSWGSSPPLGSRREGARLRRRVRSRASASVPLEWLLFGLSAVHGV